MRIYGIDFTSRPSRAKPITCAVGELSVGSAPPAALTIRELREFSDFAEYADVLASPGPWVLGMDCPLGLPRRLVAALGWPPRWADLLAHLATMDEADFAAALRDYMAARLPGDKEHFRPCDRLARSATPMKLINPPTARMLFQGVRLLHAQPTLCIPPQRPTLDNRLLLETYPALIARRFAGRLSYKGAGTSARREARRRIVDGLLGRAPMLDGRPLAALFGVMLTLAPGLEQSLLDDVQGDRLDAVSCAVTAAWSALRQADGHGIPEWAHPDEGWIVDPGMPHEPV
jgi:hypothetical protein